ncbi:MAG: SMC family ATPase [Thaumarchaeota archaeon]|nr:SMC family ATPase [Nitrososphaerota archaeon]
MNLKSISLQNIRSYKDQTIEFPLGTSLFEGDIGSGKSTILMAIEFALFGLGSQRGASLLRLGEKEGSVSLSFSVNDSDYEIIRKLTRKKNSVTQEEGSITTTQGTLVLSPAELKERILDILNFKEPVDPKAQSVIYRYAVFTPQEEMKLILAKNPKERVQTLRKAFGIEDYKTASDNANILAAQIKDSINRLMGQIADLEKKRAELEYNEKDIKKLKEDQKKILEQYEELESLQHKDKKKLDGLRKKEQRYNDANSKIPLITREIGEKSRIIENLRTHQTSLREEIDNELNPQIEKLSKKPKPTNRTKEDLGVTINILRKLEKKRSELMGERPSLMKAVDKRKKKLGEYQKKSSEQIGREIKAAEKERDQLIHHLEEIEGKLKDIGKREARLDANKTDLEQKIEELKGLKGACPICERGLTPAHKRHLKEERESKLEEIRKQIPDIEQEERQLESDRTESNKHLSELKEKIVDLKSFEKEALELEEEIGRLSQITKELSDIETKLKIKEEKGFKGLSDYENPSEHLQSLLDVLNEYLSTVDTIKGLEKNIARNESQIRENDKEIERTIANIEQSKKSLKKLDSIKERLKQIPQTVRELNQTVETRGYEIEELQQQKGRHDGRQKELSANNDRLVSEINRKENAKSLMQKFQDYHMWITGFLVPTFQTIERQVMITLRQEFESIFQKWYSMLLDEPDKETRMDEDFTPIVEQDGYEQDVDYLSGGERTSLALAYRLALNTIVQRVSGGMKSNLIILDEPTDGFSKSQLFKVRDVLRELNCPQVIIVSHETELESFANKIFEVTKSNGMSTVVSR